MKHIPKFQSTCWALLLLLCAGCARLDAPEDEVYGAADMPWEVLPVEAVLAEPDGHLEQTIAVTGTVHEVCQMAGCWLMLRALDTEAGLRVHVAREEDGSYAFTVPKDISGRQATARGMLRVADLEHEAHYQAESSAQHSGFALPPKYEMVATGVRLFPAASIQD